MHAEVFVRGVVGNILLFFASGKLPNNLLLANVPLEIKYSFVDALKNASKDAEQSSLLYRSTDCQNSSVVEQLSLHSPRCAQSYHMSTQ